MNDRRPRHVVDFHTHAFPEKVAARAVASLTESYQVHPVAEPTIAGLLGVMDEVGVDASVVAPVATRPDQVRSINDWAAENSSQRIICFGALHPDLPDVSAEVERVIGLGLKGIKCQPNFQQFSPDDRRLWPAYEAAQGRLVVLFHSGQEIAPLERVYAQPAALAQLHEAFPRLTLVLAHLGGYQMWDQVRDHLLARDIYFDTSYCPPSEMSDEAMVSLIRRHGSQRILFATDFPWGHPGRDLDRLCRLDLSQQEREAIAWENARELLRLRLE
jgi:predicted TIM-barrel fold metal-dependent hydrolase